MNSTEIRRFRKLRKMTQEQLAHKMLVDVTTIQRWESGRTEPSLGALQRLNDLFLKRSSHDHPLLDVLLALDVPVAVLDEHAVYRRVNRAFIDVTGFGDRAEVIGSYCHDVSPVWRRVTKEQDNTEPENLLFGDFASTSIAGTLYFGGKTLPVVHRVSALKQLDFSGVLIHEIECDEYQFH